MASIELAENSVVEEDLTYGELEDLLQQAEVRLRGESSTLSLVQANVPVVQSVKKSKTASLPAPAVSMKGRVAQARPETLVSQDDQRLALQGIRKVEDPIMLKRKQLKDERATTGSQWYNLPRTDLTPQLKRDLQIIRMRNVLDPHRHYKKDSAKSLVPEYSQTGTIMEGPTEFFSARIPRRQRHTSLAESVMEGERESGKMKRKYNEIQDRKRRGKKGEYRKKMERRYRGKMSV